MGKLMQDPTDDAAEATEMAEDNLIPGTTLDQEPTAGETQEGKGDAPERNIVQRRRLDRQSRFLRAFVTGRGTIRSACIDVGVSRKVVYGWEQSNVDGFKDRFEHARHDLRERLEEGLNDAIEAHPTLQILRLFRLKKEWPSAYGDSIRVVDDTSKRVLDLLSLAGRARIDDAPAPKAIEGKHRLLGG
jgi:hypothetical protein